MNKEVYWNIVNSLLMAGAVMFGAMTTGNITIESFIAAIIAGGLVAVNQFRNYWLSTEEQYRDCIKTSSKLGAFI